MRTPSLASVLLFVAASAFAQNYKWIAGLDFTSRVYQSVNKDGPGPLINVFGYDNVSGMASIMYVADQCFVAWQTWPDAGHGSVTGVIQFAPKSFALLHEDGHLKLDQQPDAAWCTPVYR
jgi:hypothetical protein